jgi:hypothetical protein
LPARRRRVAGTGAGLRDRVPPACAGAPEASARVRTGPAGRRGIRRRGVRPGARTARRPGARRRARRPRSGTAASA